MGGLPKPEPRQHRETRRGFSLVELLVVMAILSVVTALGTQTFFTVTGAWNEVRILSDLDSIANEAFESMAKDFADVLSAELSGVSLVGIPLDWPPEYPQEDSRYFHPMFEHDQVCFPIQSSGLMVRYRVVRGKVLREGQERFEHTLVRTVGEFNTDPGVPEMLPSGSPVEISDPDRADVICLRIEYADDNGVWLGKWEDPGLPRAVRASMTLAHPFQTELQIARKAVFPINVR